MVFRLRNMVPKNASEIVMTVWLDGEILEANAAAVKVSGYSREELLGSRIKMMGSGLHTKAFWQSFWSTILSWKRWEGNICNKSKDGSLIWLKTMVVPIADQNGIVTHFQVIRKGISEKIERKTTA